VAMVPLHNGCGELTMDRALRPELRGVLTEAVNAGDAIAVALRHE
jgi:hypothetical protein